MNKIVVRADLPLWYTEGFNPKPKLVFAAPLSIGTESVCEFLDLRLTERIDPEIVKAKLNANMTEEMQISEAYYPETKFTDLKWLSYSMSFKTVGASVELADKCNEVLSSDKIEILKNTKSGEQIVDIRPLIKSSVAEFDGEFLRVEAVLSADPSSFLNPEYLVKVLREKCGVLSSGDLTEEYYSIMRESAYKEDMSEFK
jgi:radical SAM-linked protein